METSSWNPFWIQNEFWTVAGYKINTQKSVVFLYTGHKKAKRKYENNSIYSDVQKNKIPRDKFNHGGERVVYWKLKHILWNLKRPKYMGKYLMYVIQRHKDFKNVQNIIQIKCNI